MGVLKVLTFLHKWLAAETHLADGEFFVSSSKQEGVSKITRKNLNTGNIQKRLANILNLNKHKLNNSASR
jgi:hypothetical protein